MTRAWRFLPLACLLAAACGRSAETRVAERILERYQRQSGAKPLASAQLIQLSLTGPGGSRGRTEITWQGPDYRERTESAGLVTVRGIQGAKGFYTDEDGVTRVASEPVLRELMTRFYFWRRAFLFQDHDKERPALGPAGEATASVRFALRWGNPLDISFTRADGSLAGVASPRFHLVYRGPTRFQDLSDPTAPVETEIAWVGLPTGPLQGAATGGGRARFGGPFAEIPLSLEQGVPILPARIGGVAVRLRLDGEASGPVQVSEAIARRAGLSFQRDVFGREVSGPAELELANLVLPVHVQKARGDLGGADAAAGGPIFRETVVELDRAAGQARLHDTTVWAPPTGYQRFIIDDDGNRPVAPLRRGAREFRVVLGAARAGSGLLLAPAAASRLGFAPTDREARDLGWANQRFAPVALTLDQAPRAPDWGDDGALGWPPLLGYRIFVDMSRRWIYLGTPGTITPDDASGPRTPGPETPRPAAGAQATPRP